MTPQSGQGTRSVSGLVFHVTLKTLALDPFITGPRTFPQTVPGYFRKRHTSTVQLFRTFFFILFQNNCFHPDTGASQLSQNHCGQSEPKAVVRPPFLLGSLGAQAYLPHLLSYDKKDSPRKGSSRPRRQEFPAGALLEQVMLKPASLAKT